MEAYVEFWIALMVVEYCFEKAILETEVVKKRRQRGGESLETKDKLKILSLKESKKKKGHAKNSSREGVRNNVFSRERIRKSLVLVLKYLFLFLNKLSI